MKLLLLVRLELRSIIDSMSSSRTSHHRISLSEVNNETRFVRPIEKLSTTYFDALHVSSTNNKNGTGSGPAQDTIKFRESKEEYLVAPRVRALEI